MNETKELAEESTFQGANAHAPITAQMICPRKMEIHFGNRLARSFALEILFEAVDAGDQPAETARGTSKAGRTDVRASVSETPSSRAEERRGATAVRVEPASALDDVKRLENRLPGVARNDRSHVGRDGAEERRSGPQGGHDGDLQPGRRLPLAVPGKVADVDRHRGPGALRTRDRRHEEV